MSLGARPSDGVRDSVRGQVVRAICLQSTQHVPGLRLPQMPGLWRHCRVPGPLHGSPDAHTAVTATLTGPGQCLLWPSTRPSLREPWVFICWVGVIMSPLVGAVGTERILTHSRSSLLATTSGRQEWQRPDSAICYPSGTGHPTEADGFYGHKPLPLLEAAGA